MTNKRVLLTTVFSLFACGLHAVLLNTQFNHYVYTSTFKVILFILCPAIYFAISKEGKFKNLFLVNKGIKNFKSFFLSGFLVFVFILIAFAVLNPLLEQSMIIKGLAETGITGSNYPFVFIYIVFINAALEEIFFRGFVFLTLYKTTYKLFAYVYSSLLFALYHVFILNNWVAPWIFILLIAGLVVAGLIFNELARRCNSIFGSLTVHISANIAINLIGVYYLYLYPYLDKVE